jgi:hypothetical protein
VDDRLGHHVRRDVGVRRELLDLADERRGPDEVADADAGADGLGERRGVDDAATVVEREHRRQWLAREADVDVGIVLEDHELRVARQLEEAAALVQRERVAGGVLEVRDDVGQPRAHALGQEPGELVDVDAVGLQRHGV